DGTPELLPFDMADGANALATADPPMHTLHRSTVFPELVARRMSTLRPDIEALVDDFLTRALAAALFDAMHDLANAIPIRGVSRLTGFRAEDPDLPLQAAFASTAMLAGVHSLAEINACMARTAESLAFVSEQLQLTIDRGGDGIIGVIGEAVARGDMEEFDGL